MTDTITNVDKPRMELKETLFEGVDWIQVPAVETRSCGHDRISSSTSDGELHDGRAKVSYAP
jgi:hypothetical protein